MKARSRARARALQVLYAWDARKREVDPRTLLSDLYQARAAAVETGRYIERLLAVVAEYGAEIDQELQQALTNWKLERVSTVDRNILRIAAAEMLFISEVPHPVSIQEAIILAERYGTAESPRFVNGVLDALSRTLGGFGKATERL